METATTDIALIAHSIQLSLAPVFLLSGIGVMLGVLTNRLCSNRRPGPAPSEERLKQADGAHAAALHEQTQSIRPESTPDEHIHHTGRGVQPLLIAAVQVALLFSSALVKLQPRRTGIRAVYRSDVSLPWSSDWQTLSAELPHRYSNFAHRPQQPLSRKGSPGSGATLVRRRLQAQSPYIAAGRESLYVEVSRTSNRRS
jgi:hypothetical protein